jgi:hypothetical protein
VSRHGNHGSKRDAAVKELVITKVAAFTDGLVSTRIVTRHDHAVEHTTIEGLVDAGVGVREGLGREYEGASRDISQVQVLAHDTDHNRNLRVFVVLVLDAARLDDALVCLVKGNMAETVEATCVAIVRARLHDGGMVEC